MILTDIHTHTKFSADGRGDIRDMIETALAKGISYYGISEHVNYDYTEQGIEIEGRNRKRDQYSALFSNRARLAGRIPRQTASFDRLRIRLSRRALLLSGIPKDHRFVSSRFRGEQHSYLYGRRMLFSRIHARQGKARRLQRLFSGGFGESGRALPLRYRGAHSDIVRATPYMPTPRSVTKIFPKYSTVFCTGSLKKIKSSRSILPPRRRAAPFSPTRIFCGGTMRWEAGKFPTPRTRTIRRASWKNGISLCRRRQKVGFSCLSVPDCGKILQIEI